MGAMQQDAYLFMVNNMAGPGASSVLTSGGAWGHGVVGKVASRSGKGCDHGRKSRSKRSLMTNK